MRLLKKGIKYFGTQSLGKRRPGSPGCLFLFLFLFLMGNNSTQAQTKTTTHAEQIWLGFLNQTRLSKHWGVWADFHLRTKDNFFDGLFQAIVRPGITYYKSDDLKFTLGYAYVNHFPGDNHAHVSQPEHRPWQQVQWHTRYPKLKLMQWIRLEERFRRKIKDAYTLAPGTQFNFKLRYNLYAAFPLGPKKFQPKSLSGVLNNEVHINFGKEIVNNYFDQNRFFAGFQYQINPQNSIQFGYQYFFQQLAAGNQYKGNSIARIFYFQNLDWRNKSVKTK